MNKIYLLVSFIFLVYIHLFGQSWNWVKPEMGGDPPYDHICASDNTGNIYLVGQILNFYKFNDIGDSLWTWDPTVVEATPAQINSIGIYSGYEYVSGTFSYGYMTFGSDTLNTNTTSMFIIKVSNSGVFQWAKKANDIVSQNSLACDGNGNAYITGNYVDTAIFSQDTLINPFGEASMYLVKYAPNGTVLWAKTSHKTNDVDQIYPNSIAVDKKGNSYVTGYYHGTVILGNDTLPITTSTSSWCNLFIIKYNTSGVVQWTSAAKMPSSAGYSGGVSVSVDGVGNSYIGGWFEGGTVTFGSTTLGPVTPGTPFITKFNSSGKADWVYEGVPLDSNEWQGNSVAADSLENIYYILKGTTSHNSFSLKFGSDSIISYRLGDNAIFQFDSSGNVICGALFSEGGEDDGDGLCVSPNGKYVYVAGDLFDTAYFGRDTFAVGESGEPLFIANWKPCGQSTEDVENIDNTNLGIMIYPNPNKGVFTLSCNSVSRPLLQIYNIFGETLLTKPLRSAYGDNTINLSNQPNGVYLYRVVTQSGQLLGEGKIIVQK